MNKKVPLEGLSNTEIEVLVRRAAFRWYRQRLSAQLNRLAAWWQLQWSLRELRRLDDNQLRDIGLRRDQLHAGHFRAEK